MVEAIRTSDNRRAKIKAGRRLHGVIEEDVLKSVPSNTSIQCLSEEDEREKERRQKETERLKKLSSKIKKKLRTIRKTAQENRRKAAALAEKTSSQSMSSSLKMEMSMLSTADAVRKALIAGGPDPMASSQPSNNFRVRNSVLTTSKKQQAKDRMHFEKIFRKAERSSRMRDVSPRRSTSGQNVASRVPPDKKKKKKKKPTGPQKSGSAKLSLVGALSMQENAPLHFGMEISLQSATEHASYEEDEFLSVTHPGK